MHMSTAAALPEHDAVDPMNTSTPAERQMLLAMRSLDHQKQVIEARLGQTRKSWTMRLTESTMGLNELIRDTVPSGEDRCHDRIVSIQEADTAHQTLQAQKLVELEHLKQQHAETQAAFYEILRRRSNPDQTNLNFRADDGAHIDPDAGLMLSAAHLDCVRSAATSYSDSAEGEVDGMAELTARLDELGVAGLGLPAEMGPEDGDDDGGEIGDGDADGMV